jgi:hypothetical protein
MLANILQGILDFVGMLVGSVLNALPDSPFDSITGVLGQWASWINYFIPIGQMVTLLASYTGAVAVWYGVRWILRFSRYIQ